MATQISIPFTLLTAPDTIAETWDPNNGATATIKFKCLWTDRYQLIRDLVGTYTGTPPSSITRVPPYRYPDSPNLFCTAIASVEPFGKLQAWASIGLPWIARKYAIVTAVFSVPHWDFQGSDAYTKISFSASGEFLTIPETTYQFSDGTPVNSPIGVMIPQMEITVTRNRMPFLPVAAMAAIQGKISNATYTIGGYGFPAETLLFMAGQSDYQIDAAGTVAFSQEYKFLWRPVSWNKYLHPVRGQGFQYVDDGGGNHPYSQGDFSTLP